MQKSQTEWQRLRAGDFTWVVRKGLTELHEFLAAPHEFIANAREWLKEPALARLRLSSGRRLIVKEYSARNLLERLKTVLRQPRANHALTILLRLQELEVPALTPVAVGNRRRRPWQSYLVTQEVTDARPLSEFRRPDQPSRRRVIRALAQSMAKMHTAGLDHGDAHHANFLVREGHSPEVFLADVDSVRHRSRITLNMAARGLVRLLDYTSPTPREKLYFAAVYCRARGGEINARDLVRKMQR